MLVDLRPCFRMRGNGMFTEVRRCPALTGHTRLDILLADHNLPPDRQSAEQSSIYGLGLLISYWSCRESWRRNS